MSPEEAVVPEKSGLLGPLGLVFFFILVAEIIAGAALLLSGATTADKVVAGFKLMVAKEEKKETKAEPEGIFAGVTSSLELADTVKKAQKDFNSREAKLRERADELKQLKTEFTRFQADVKDERAALDVKRGNFEAQVKEYIERTRATGFQEAVGIYQKMEPQDVANMLLVKPETEMIQIVELVRAFKPSFLAEVLTEMKKLEEQKGQIMGETRTARILSKIRAGEPIVKSPLPEGGNKE